MVTETQIKPMRILPKKLLSVIKQPLLRREKARDLRAASGIDVSQVKTLCLALGPYRNLTTLTASLLFLHPECQVLNHGSSRIFGDPQLDFLQDYSDSAFDNFLRFAIYISGSGSRGKEGGSITKSHAFDGKHKMQELFQSSYGDKLVKDRIDSVFWKESLRTSLHIRERNIDLGRIFERNDRLRFLLPVRNPIDCALSNKRTGHAKLFGLSKESPVEEILAAVLDEFFWFHELRAQFPGRFFYYLENAFSQETAIQLADFLCISPYPDWQQAVLEVFDIDRHYDHPAGLLDSYAELVKEKFAAHPVFRDELLSFT